MEKHRIDQNKMDKTLDDILRYLKSVIRIEDQNHIQFLSPVDVFFNCYGKDLDDLKNYTEPTLFLEKLLRDGNVDQSIDSNEFRINLSGIEFINNGGYHSLRQKAKHEKYFTVLKYILVFLNAATLLFFAFQESRKGSVELSSTPNNDTVTTVPAFPILEMQNNMPKTDTLRHNHSKESNF